MALLVAKRELLMYALDRSGCNRLLGLAGTWNGLLVLNYHRIGDPGDSLFERGLWSASEEQFDRQVRHLVQNFDVVGIDDLEHISRRRSGRCVLITFDDGYRDNFELAFPILRSHNATATFFIATGFLDRPRIPWWDDISWMVRSSRRSEIDANPWTIQPVAFGRMDRQLAIRQCSYTYRQLGSGETEDYLDFLAEATGSGRCPGTLADGLWMTWDMVREMDREGMCFGGHTANHPILANLSPEEQNLEFLECRVRLEHELGKQISALSYPNGDPASFNDVTRQMATKHGLRWVFSYYGGYCRPGQFDHFNMPRSAVERNMSLPLFRSLTALPQLFA